MMDVKAITELVGGLGVPGAILVFAVWKLAPVSVRLVEVLTEVRDAIREMRQEIRELPDRLLPAH